ncbi:S24 family peptidase [Marinobacter nauticus]|uniref:Peptidase S24/S26A/S26B/S26C domain-containing protein n=1 Tax=Marinobacter nauticus TaxID=2743 RepID=A0A1M2V0U4_MARNT|nr:helix-turn-helix transcriptional regulator [Marinobacter nauticus]OJT01207.1 hypothetical protein BEE62_14750 [Marinobacter nauticus]
MDISEIRRANLLGLIKEAGSRQNFIKLTGKSDAQISQLLSSGENSRNVGNKLARDFEQAMGKERGWMDRLDIMNQASYLGAQAFKEREGDPSLPDDKAAELFDAEEMERSVFHDYDSVPDEPEAEMAGHMDAWDSDTPIGPDETELPLFREVEMAGGSGATTVQENHGAKLRFAKSTLRRAGVLQEHAACAFVRGNSMEPMMPDGACIGINTADTKIRDGKVYAIDHGGMLRVKILHRKPGGGLKIVSLNSEEHPTEEYSQEYVMDNIKIKGRVFWYSGLI